MNSNIARFILKSVLATGMLILGASAASAQQSDGMPHPEYGQPAPSAIPNTTQPNPGYSGGAWQNQQQQQQLQEQQAAAARQELERRKEQCEAQAENEYAQCKANNPNGYCQVRSCF